MKVKWNVKAIASACGLTIKELAEKADINPNHLRTVSAGKAKLTGDDIVKLHKLTGIEVTDIKTG